MDASSIAGAATSMAQQNTDNAVSTALLRKALDMQASAAMQLIAALPQPAQFNLPAHLGRNVNTTA